MKMRRWSILVAIFLLFAGGSLVPNAQAAKTPVFHYDRLFYYRDGKAAKQSLFAHPGSIDIFAPQDYSIGADGTLSGSLEPDVLAFTKKHKIKVMPLVTNGNFSRATYKAFLSDPTKEAIAISALVQEAQTRGYVGWQFDFEQMDASDRDAYSAFVASTGSALHAAGLTLSVAVVARFSDTPADYKSTLWQDLIGVYDYDALASSTDFITLMSYDDPESAGPIAPMEWLNRILAYSLLHIPANKLSFGIPLYYWQRSDLTGKIVELGGRKGIDAVFAKHKVAVHYDAKQEEPWFHYYSKTFGYTVWYENARSVAAKIALVKKYKLKGASFWALGLELPSIYQSIKE